MNKIAGISCLPLEGGKALRAASFVLRFAH